MKIVIDANQGTVIIAASDFWDELDRLLVSAGPTRIRRLAVANAGASCMRTSTLTPLRSCLKRACRYGR
jgi:hypothetical protein